MKSTIVVLACAAGTASAFTETSPSASARYTSSYYGSNSAAKIKSAMDEYEGAITFDATEFKFDPLRLSETYEPLLPWFRESELRHGRTAMLAVLGFITADFVRIPGEVFSFESIPKTIDAYDALLLKNNGPMLQLLFCIGLFDLIVTAPACVATMNGERDPGDFSWHLFKPTDDFDYKKKKQSELLNGRLAMFAIGGIVTQSVISGHNFPYV